MLEKILNIKSESGYNGGGNYQHPGAFNRQNGRPAVQERPRGDSLSFSPAAAYLAKIDWHLKEVDFSANDRLMLVFITGNLEFRTCIEFLRTGSRSRLFYDISDTLSISGPKPVLTISVSSAGFEPAELIKPAELKLVSRLMQRVRELGLTGEMDKYNNPSLSMLLEGLEQQLMNEFEFINMSLFSLVQILSGNRFKWVSMASGELTTESITIERISSNK